VLSLLKVNNPVPYRRVLCGVLLLVTVVALAACGGKEKKAGQALVRVNGEEITVLQLNDELSRAGVKADQQEAATKQLLESLIDRQLIVAEAMRLKIDRSPDVMKAIERAKALIIAQAYLQSRTSNSYKPHMGEIDDYFKKHPEYFTQRKQFDMQQLVAATKDISNEFKSAVESARSLDEVAAWLDKHKVRYARREISLSTTDLPENSQLLAKLKDMKKGELFIVKDGENNLINTITEVKDTPITAEKALPLIERYLINKNAKEVMEAEVAHLRSSAKIEYLNASAKAPPKENAAVHVPITAPETRPAGAAEAGKTESGATGPK
jgi:EpsD family peptidyl-prolyl cis-trans isomerase